MCHSDCFRSSSRLWDCNLSVNDVSAVCRALQSNPSHIRELQFGFNKIRDDGGEVLSSLLAIPECRLSTLRSVPARMGRMNGGGVSWSPNAASPLQAELLRPDGAELRVPVRGAGDQPVPPEGPGADQQQAAGLGSEAALRLPGESGMQTGDSQVGPRNPRVPSLHHSSSFHFRFVHMFKTAIGKERNGGKVPPERR